MRDKQIVKKNTFWNATAYTMGRKAATPGNRRTRAFIYRSSQGERGKAHDHTATPLTQVDDATWDAVVEQLMEEHDGAWTRLADL